MHLEEEKRKSLSQSQETDFSWEGQALLDQAWENYLKREAFAYDPAKDPLYRQYEQKYTQLGRLAMEDTVGAASALTGGYANSYAQTAGQQAYNSYMQRLGDVLPTLYADAYDRYRAEGEALYDEVVLRQEQRRQAYQEHLDRQSWQNKLAQQEYQRQQDALALQLKQEQFAYQQEQDRQSWENKLAQQAYQREQDALDRELAREQQIYKQQQDALAWQKEQEQLAYQRQQAEYERLAEMIAVGYRPGDEELLAAGMTRDQADILAASFAGGTSGGQGGGSQSSGSAKVTYDTHGYKKVDIRKLQEAAGLMVDGVWGEETQKAYEEGWRSTGTANTQRVADSIVKESQLTPHDLVAYGSYRDYVAYTILSSGLSDKEEDYLIRTFREDHPEFGSDWAMEGHLQTLRDRGLL